MQKVQARSTSLHEVDDSTVIPALQREVGGVRCISRPTEQVAPVILKVERSAEELHRAFLTRKIKEKGQFSLSERLEYRYIEYIDAKGIAKVAAFFKWGGLAALTFGNLTEEQKEELRQECRFYRSLCNVVSSFRKDVKETGFAEAQRSFESFLAGHPFVDFELVNQIVNANVGKDVARALVEAQSHRMLTAGGRVTAENIHSTFESRSLMRTLNQLYDKGYRPQMTEDEALKSEGEQFGVEEFLLPLFVAFVRPYHATPANMHRMALKSLVSEDHVGRSNGQLFALIQDHSRKITDADLPVGITRQQFLELRRTYSLYNLEAFNERKSESLRANIETEMEDTARNLELIQFTSEDCNAIYASARNVPKELREEIASAQKKVDDAKAELKDHEAAVHQTIAKLSDKEVVYAAAGESEKLAALKIEEELKDWHQFYGKKNDKLQPLAEREKHLRDLAELHDEHLGYHQWWVKEHAAIKDKIAILQEELQEIDAKTNALAAAVQRAEMAWASKIITTIPYVQQINNRDVQVKMGAYFYFANLMGKLEIALQQNIPNLNLKMYRQRAMDAGFKMEGDAIVGIDFAPFQSDEIKSRQQHARRLTELFMHHARQLGKSFDQLNGEVASRVLRVTQDTR